MNEGWIKIHRKITDWEWYQYPNVFAVFMHCLIRANHKDRKWQGIEIKKGEFISSYANMSAELSGRHGTISVMQIRTALKKLISTGEITIKTTNRYSLIKVNNWDLHQVDNTQDNKQITNKQQTDNKQITTDKNVKKDKTEKNDKNLNSETFEFFWKMYPKKKAKPKAFDYWKKLKINEELFRNIVGSLQAQMESADWQKDGGKFIPYPQKWIIEQRWLDEEVPAVQFSKPFNFNF